jgi:hypothetical protein
MAEDMDESTPRKPSPNQPAFDIDDRVFLRIERELAVQLGELVLQTDTKNTALLAIGHQLRNMNREQQ